MKIWIVRDKEGVVRGAGMTVQEAIPKSLITSTDNISFLIAAWTESAVKRGWTIHRVEFTEKNFVHYNE